MEKPIPKRSHCYIGFLLILSILPGCQYDKSLGYSDKPPKAVNLIGTWEPTSDSIENMKTRGGYKISTHKLILRNDGTFLMINMPDCVFSGGEAGWEDSHKKFRSGSGKWRIVTFQDKGRKVWDVDFDLDSKDVGLLPSVPVGVLQGNEQDYRLHFSFGDLDFSQAIDFYRKSS